MITFQISPIQLEGFSDFAGKSTGIFSSLEQGNSDFSNILNQLQNSGQFDTEQNNAFSYDNLSPEYLQMLQNLIEDGKSLPQAAEFVFAEIQQQLATLIEKEVTTEELQQAYVQLSIVARILPEDIKNQLKAALKELKQILAPAQSELAVNPEKTLSPIDNKAEASPLPQAPPTASSIVPEVAQQRAGTETAPPITEAKPHTEAGQPQSTVKSKPDFNGFSSSPNLNTANQAARAPVFTQDAYGQQPEINASLNTEKLMLDGKPILAGAPNVTSAKISASMNLDNFTVATSVSSNANPGSSAGFSSSGQNTSFAQLFSQAVPQPVTQNIHKPEWGNAVAQRITWMAGNKLQSAQLRINPAHLGPVEIKIKIENSMANVSFVSNHQVVREALEQSIPRLREMLEEQNLDLVNVDIGQQPQPEKGETADEFSPFSMQASAEDLAGSEQSVSLAQNRPVIIDVSALLDTYA